MRLIPLIILGLCLNLPSGNAQSWSNPDRTEYRQDRNTPDDGRLGELTKAIQELLDKGERERLADPWFLKDLRDLVNRYHRPWSRTLLTDDFSARGTRPQAPWKIVNGEFRVDWRYGLRALVLPSRRSAASQPQAPSNQNQQGDAVQQLFGALLNQALKGAQQENSANNSDNDRRSAGVGRDGIAEIAAPKALSNAFAITIGVTARPLSGSDGTRFSVGVYQGQNGAGYRVVALADGNEQQTRVRLLRINSRGGRSVIDEVVADFRLDPELPTILKWTRTPSGEMGVQVGEKQIMRTVDRGFKDPFDGFLLRVGSGDLALRHIRIDGI